MREQVRPTLVARRGTMRTLSGMATGVAVATLMGVMCLAEQAAIAQPFEHLYGDPTTVDVAGRRTRPVASCPGGGIVAVGTARNVAAMTMDVYLVRLALNGTPISETIYDIGKVDTGLSVVEVTGGGGFVIAGMT